MGFACEMDNDSDDSNNAFLKKNIVWITHILFCENERWYSRCSQMTSENLGKSVRYDLFDGVSQLATYSCIVFC